jgi:dinuclear metal center YbgI/SA1388 family protein
MIITHHPIIFHPIKRFNSASYVERAVERAIRHDIVLYACHTNLDSAVGGLSWRVAEMLAMESVEVLQPTNDAGAGFGVVGELSSPKAVEEFLQQVMRTFGVKVVRHSDLVKSEVRRIAICTGAGGSLIDDALASGADLYLTADLRYNDFMRHENRLILCDIGHFESEFCAIDILFDILSKNFCNFAARKSVHSRNPINYTVRE